MDGRVMQTEAEAVSSLTPALSQGERERKAAGRAALADPVVLAGRREMLAAPRRARLRECVAKVRAAHGPTPDFDPAGGGDTARVLLLLETPGPAICRTGFVSIDNPTGTSANLRRFLAEAGVPRSGMVIWNTVPWVIHTGGLNRAPKSAEIRTGLAALPGLLPLLPELRCVVLAGRIAGMAGPVIGGLRQDLALIPVPHPSPTYVCTSPDISRRIVAGLVQAARLVRVDPSPLPSPSREEGEERAPTSSRPRPRRRPDAGSRTVGDATPGGTSTPPRAPGRG